MNKARGLRAATVTASAAALTAAIAAPAAAANFYTVQPGDTLGAIADRHGVPLGDLFRLNGLGWSSIIYPGQQIRLADDAGASAPATPAPAPSVTYTVRSGDSLWAISQQTGVSLNDLFRLNGLGPASTIYPGQQIILRQAGAPVSTPAPATQTAAPRSAAPAAAQHPAAPAAAKSATAPAAAPQAATGSERPSWWNEETFRHKTMWGVSEKTGLSLDELFAGGHGGSTGTESAAQIQGIVRQTAAEMGVPAPLALAIAEQESSFRQNVTSPAGAIGVMQIMPANASWVSSLAGRNLDLRNTADNVAAGVAMLRWLLRQAPAEDIAIAGYYQGLYGVQAYGMYPDTRAYVAQVKQRMAKYS